MQNARAFEAKTGYGSEGEAIYKREATATTSFLGFVSGHVPDFFQAYMVAPLIPCLSDVFDVSSQRVCLYRSVLLLNMVGLLRGGFHVH